MAHKTFQQKAIEIFIDLVDSFFDRLDWLLSIFDKGGK